MTLLALLSGCIACVGASLAEFDPYTSPNGDGCVDPKGFQQCYQEAAATAVECGGPSYCENDQLRGARSYTECLATCKSIQSENNLLCWVQSCWNKVCIPVPPLVYVIWTLANVEARDSHASIKLLP